MRNADGRFIRFSVVFFLITGLAMGQSTIALPTGATMTAYRPQQSSRGAGTAVIICPGGGYNLICDQTEGTPQANWFNSFGVTAFVLYYHVGSAARYPAPLLDLQAALRYVRLHAEQFSIDSAKVGVMGFSAGGHLSAVASVFWDRGDATATDPLKQQSCRPNFTILGYPVISMRDGITHVGTRSNCIGLNPSQSMIDSLSCEKHVSEQTPPAFLTHGDADFTVNIQNSYLYRDSLAAHGIDVELVVEPGKDHGYLPNNLNGVTWPDACIGWLEQEGFLQKTSTRAAPAIRETGELCRSDETVNIPVGHGLSEIPVGAKNVVSPLGRRMIRHQDSGGAAGMYLTPVP